MDLRRDIGQLLLQLALLPGQGGYLIIVGPVFLLVFQEGRLAFLQGLLALVGKRHALFDAQPLNAEQLIHGRLQAGGCVAEYSLLLLLVANIPFRDGDVFLKPALFIHETGIDMPCSNGCVIGTFQCTDIACDKTQQPVEQNTQDHTQHHNGELL